MKPLFNTLWMLGIALSLSACISGSHYRKVASAAAGSLFADLRQIGRAHV